MKVDQPRKGDTVYDERRVDRGLQPNGYVLNVSRGAEEVTVKFHDTVWSKHTQVVYSLGDFLIRNKQQQWAFYIGDPQP